MQQLTRPTTHVCLEWLWAGPVCFFPDKLFVLLMELATDSANDIIVDGQVLTSLACSALISLTIALGDTGKLLTAIKALLMSSPGLASQKTVVGKFFFFLAKRWNKIAGLGTKRVLNCQINLSCSVKNIIYA